MQTRLAFVTNDLVRDTSPQEKLGAVYTKSWVVDLILDLAGYTSDADLVSSIAIEPSTGEGAFLLAMALRLVESARLHRRSLLDCGDSLIAYELEEKTAQVARSAVIKALIANGTSVDDAETLTGKWIRIGDYLLEAPSLPTATFVIGNPPYIRLEDIEDERADLYRSEYSTMKGRADIYIAFFQAALSQLTKDGVCAFICADRWMLNQYGEELRRFITSGYAVESVIEMHNADAFLSDVSAYPAVTVIRKSKQGRVVVASVDRNVKENGSRLSQALLALSSADKDITEPGLVAGTFNNWFSGRQPWPCKSPRQLAVLKKLEAEFPPLEDSATRTKVGIGVATGADEIFITKNPSFVEPSRLLPLAMASDIKGGVLEWSGNYLINPWDDDGLVDLRKHVLLEAYLVSFGAALRRRHVAKRNPDSWMRTIDRVNISLVHTPKLYIADITERINPVLDHGVTYPHHNLYFVHSEKWDLEVLGALLLSDFGQFFVESYGVRMRGGYLRFQAQYLRRIRVPELSAISIEQEQVLKTAFRKRDIEAATKIASALYKMDASEVVRGR
ncbi:MAG TPA: Eco57I restriction-modification methylase domain-containing protein [Pyrinomonadaceae bacterium]|nr:Eco57I restriction-modification methylase domain-containing protein [Pyrinomonadaceae bacterium]